MSKKLSLLAGLVAVVLTIAACGPATPPPQSMWPTVPPLPPIREGTGYIIEERCCPECEELGWTGAKTYVITNTSQSTLTVGFSGAEIYVPKDGKISGISDGVTLELRTAGATAYETIDTNRCPFTSRAKPSAPTGAAPLHYNIDVQNTRGNGPR